MANETHKLYGGTEIITFRDRGHTYNHRIHGIVPNATGVCKMLDKPKLRPWAARMSSDYWKRAIEPGEMYDEIELAKIHEAAMENYNKYSGERRDVGKLVHKWAEEMAHYEMGLRNSEPKMPINADVQRGCRAWLAWRSQYPDLEWKFAERILYHKDDVHVGTADGLVYLNLRESARIGNESRPTVLDYKTGSGVWMEAGLQLASYCKSAACEFGPPWDDADRLIVHLNSKTGKMVEWDEAKIQEKLTGGDVDEDYECFLGLLSAYRWVANGPNKWAFFGRQ